MVRTTTGGIIVEVDQAGSITIFGKARRSSFALNLRYLRRKCGQKQIWLAHATGCTDAAVSLWESGKRLPRARTVGKIVHALIQNGASTVEVAELLVAWREAVSSRHTDAARLARRSICPSSPF